MSSSTYSPPKHINVSQAARLLGKGEASIRRWIQQFSIPTSVESGQNMLSPNMVGVLQQIKALREQNLRAEDIELNIADALEAERQLLQQEAPATGQAESSSEVARQMMAELTDALTEHNEALAQSVHAAVQQASRMADRYAESQRELGRMEAMLQGIQYQLREAEQKARLLPEKAEALQAREREAQDLHARLQQAEREQEKLNDDLRRERESLQELRAAHESLNNKLENVQDTLDKTQAENQSLREALNQERGRSWWDKLTKGAASNHNGEASG